MLIQNTSPPCTPVLPGVAGMKLPFHHSQRTGTMQSPNHAPQSVHSVLRALHPSQAGGPPEIPRPSRRAGVLEALQPAQWRGSPEVPHPSWRACSPETLLSGQRAGTPEGPDPSQRARSPQAMPATRRGGTQEALHPSQRAADLAVQHPAGGQQLQPEPDSPHTDTRIKCVLAGDGAVGKTSLVVSYATNGYPSEYQPTTYDNYNVVVMVDGHPVKLQICDIAGQDDFDRLRPVWYADTDVFLVCFSVVSPASFQNVVQKWVPEIRRYRPGAALVLVGTQSDLRSNVQVLIELSRYKESPVSEADARRMAAHIRAACYLECSALTQRNMKEVFDQCILSGLEVRGRRGPGSAVSPRPRADTPLTSADSGSPRRRKRRGWRRLLCV